MSIPSIIGMQDKSLWLKRAAGFLYWWKGKSWIFGQPFTEKGQVIYECVLKCKRIHRNFRLDVLMIHWGPSHVGE